MAQYIMSITAQDRSGIVAGVSDAILALKGNLEAASQTVHQGYFAMILLCAFPDTIVEQEVTRLIREKAGSDLHVFITTYQTSWPMKTNCQTQSFIVTAVGPDKPGILHQLSAYLASKDINIDDLYACIDGNDFIVICQVSVPSDLDIFILQSDLDNFGKSKGFTAHMQHENIFVATNELRLGKISS